MRRIAWALSILFLFSCAVEAPAKKPKKPKTPRTKKDAEKGPQFDILTTVKNAPTCKMWAKAIETAGLTETYKGKKTLTLLVPSDDAFDKLKKEDVEALFKDKDKLARIIAFHTIEGKKLLADEMLRQTTVQNSLSATLPVSKDGDGNFVVAEAVLLSPNIAATNGMIHVINKVLMPPAD